MERTDSRPLLRIGARLSSVVTAPVRMAKNPLSMTTSPAVTGSQRWYATSAEPVRHSRPRVLRTIHAREMKRPLSRSSRMPSERTSWSVALTRPSAACCRPWARVMGMSEVISRTREDSCSIRRRKSSFWSRSLRRSLITSSPAAGTTIRKTGRKDGARSPMTTRPPTRVTRAASPRSALCMSICSIASASRITLACRTLELVFAW